MKDYAEELAEAAAFMFGREEQDILIEVLATRIRHKVDELFVLRQRELELSDG